MPNADDARTIEDGNIPMRAEVPIEPELLHELMRVGATSSEIKGAMNGWIKINDLRAKYLEGKAGE